MRSNRLQVNPSKTEVLWCSSSRRQHQIPTSPVRIGSTNVLLVTSVRDLGLYIDCDVSLQTHVTVTVRSCFAALRQIRSVRRCLPRHALLSLIRALVICMVDYCCSVLAVVSCQLLYRLQSILNAAARLVFSVRRSEHIAPLLRELHWLWVLERITFRLCVLTHRCLNGSSEMTYIVSSGTLNSTHSLISAGIPRREHSSDSRRGKPPSTTVIHNNNACRSAGAEIYPR